MDIDATDIAAVSDAMTASEASQRCLMDRPFVSCRVRPRPAARCDSCRREQVRESRGSASNIARTIVEDPQRRYTGCQVWGKKNNRSTGYQVCRRSVFDLILA